MIRRLLLSAGRALWREKLWILGFLVLSRLFFLAAETHAAEVNTQWKTKDQGAYLKLSRSYALGDRVNDGARGPLSFFLFSRVWENGSFDDYFRRAKQLGIYVAYATVIVLFLVQWWLNGRTLAAVATTSSAFLLVAMFAGYVKSEATFFCLLGAGYLVCLEVLDRPRLLPAAIAGGTLGVAQLLKASALPVLPLFVACSAVAAGSDLWRGGVPWKLALLRRVSAAIVLCSSFYCVTATYYADNERRFGVATYNVNTLFYVYYDSWGEVAKGTRAHSDRTGYPDLPKKKLPSAKKYFAEDPWGKAWSRLSKGLEANLENSVKAWGFLRHWLLALTAVMASALYFRRRLRSVSEVLPLFLFHGGFLVGMGLAMTWFHAVHPGLRFPLTLFVPGVAGAAFLVHRIFRDAPVAAASGGEHTSDRRLRPPHFFLLPLALLLVVDVPLIVFHAASRHPEAGW